MSNKPPRQQRGHARTRRPERTRVEMRMLSLDQMIEPGHRVRLLWRYCESLDLSELYHDIRATVGYVGRPPRSTRGSSSRCGSTPRSKGSSVPGNSIGFASDGGHRLIVETG